VRIGFHPPVLARRRGEGKPNAKYAKGGPARARSAQETGYGRQAAHAVRRRNAVCTFAISSGFPKKA